MPSNQKPKLLRTYKRNLIYLAGAVLVVHCIK